MSTIVIQICDFYVKFSRKQVDTVIVLQSLNIDTFPLHDKRFINA